MVNLKRHQRAVFDALGQEWANRYLTKQGQAVFSMVKPSESVRTLEVLGNDLFFLVERFKSDPHVTGMSSYQLLVRLLREQCRVEQDPETKGPTVSIKPNKEIPSDSLQNPSDPDASYDGHKGQGYQMQVAETYARDETQKKKSPCLITEVIVEPAHRSDAEALIPLIEATQERGVGPEQVLADSLYGGDDNCQKARERSVEVISPVIGRHQENELTLADFSWTEEGTIMACPQGHVAQKGKHKKGKHTVIFAPRVCIVCPRINDCPVKAGKRGSYLHYDDKALRLAKRRAYEKTPAFQEVYRLRVGVEGTMSQLDRKTGLKHLRVRGLRAGSFCATFKAAGLNLLRAVAFRNSQENENLVLQQRNPGLFGLFSIFKEQFSALWADFNSFGSYFSRNQLFATNKDILTFYGTIKTSFLFI